MANHERADSPERRFSPYIRTFQNSRRSEELQMGGQPAPHPVRRGGTEFSPSSSTRLSFLEARQLFLKECGTNMFSKSPPLNCTYPRVGSHISVCPLFLKLTFRMNSTHWVAVCFSLRAVTHRPRFALPNHSSVHLGLDFPAKRSWYKVEGR